VFIVIEGPDGVGKGTQVSLLVEQLKSHGFDVWQTREPTDSEYGRRIRRMLDKQEPMLPATDFQMLYTQDRAEHLPELVEHLGQPGVVVVCDRYYYSTYAYGAAGGADVEQLRQANSKFPVPDLMLWLNLDTESARTRMEAGRDALDEHDKNLSFQDRLQLEYTKLVDEFPEAVEIDATGSPEEVHQRIRKAVEEILPKAE
jgi:dTMP kinase